MCLKFGMAMRKWLGRGQKNKHKWNGMNTYDDIHYLKC